MLNTIKSKGFSERYYLKVFLICLFTATITILPFIIRANGIFTLEADFNVQQIPFNMISNESIKSGDVYWSWYTDLGSQFMGAYSFYTLGSPFFWISMLFPSSAFPYLVGPLLILKYCVAGMTAYAYTQRFVTDKNYAVIAALLYAFCGFQTGNLMFNHFHDVVAFFPLLLVALEESMTNKRWGLLTLAIALNAVINYYFFVGEIVFLVIYFCVRWLIPDFKGNIRLLPRCILEVVIGIGIAAIIFLPSILFIMKNPRADTFFYGGSGIAFSGDQYLNLLKSIMMPGEVITNTSVTYLANKFDSCFAYLPLVGFTLVASYLFYARKNWVSRIIVICMIMACIPILNSFFYALTATAYFRWFYMPILLFAVASAVIMEKRTEARSEIKKGIILTLVLIGILIFYTAFYPWGEGVNGAIRRDKLFWGYAAIAVAGILLTAYFCLHQGLNERRFQIGLLILVVIFSIGTTGVNVFLMQRTSDPASENAYNVQREQEIKLPEGKDYRIKLDFITDNFALVNRTPSIETYSSTVNGSIFEFYQGLGSVRFNVSDSHRLGIPELLSVKYIVTTQKHESEQEIALYDDGYRTTYVYEAKDFIPIGFTYNYYITEEQMASIDSEKRGIALLKAVVLSEEEIRQVEGKLQPLPTEELSNLSEKDIVQLTEQRKMEASYYFDRYNEGFVSKIMSDGDKYAYFSVPYDDGWSATVNGVETEIINSNGMMLVTVSQGDNIIEFRYFSKDTAIGIGITIISAALYAVYIFICRRKKLALKR